jgi:hypothetical protein
MATSMTTPSTERQLKEEENAGVELAVVSGIHHGVVITLACADYAVGSAPNADIVLRDPGVAAEHARLRVERGLVCVEATGGNVAVGQTFVEKGHGCRVREPVDITLGEARLRLSPIDSADGVLGLELRKFLAGRSHALGEAPSGVELRKFLADRPRALVGAVTCLILAVSIVVARGFASSARAPTAEGSTRVAFTDRAEIPQSTTNEQAATTTMDHAMRDLTDHLARANIHMLHISTVDDRLVVTGKLNRQEAVAWAAVQQWFDQTYGDFVLTANVTVGDGQDTPSFQLQAVWYGDQPYVIGSDGERYYQGSVLDNGWVIREVDEDRLLLNKGSETLVVTYR